MCNNYGLKRRSSSNTVIPSRNSPASLAFHGSTNRPITYILSILSEHHRQPDSSSVSKTKKNKKTQQFLLWFMHDLNQSDGKKKLPWGQSRKQRSFTREFTYYKYKSAMCFIDFIWVWLTSLSLLQRQILVGKHILKGQARNGWCTHSHITHSDCTK